MKFRVLTIAVLISAIAVAMLFGTLSGYTTSSSHEIGIVPDVKATPTPQTTPIIAIGAIGGTVKVGQSLSAGALTPAGATATYQWQRCSTSGGAYANISGATSNTYALVAGDYGYFIKVSATGTGNYSGTVTSAYKGPVAIGSITAIGDISGTAQVGQTLTAGDLTPDGATATYQWQRCSTSGGTYSNITGATSSMYTLVSGDYKYYVRAVATGTGNYTGTATSDFIGPVTKPLTGIDSISGTAKVGQTLTAGSLSPSGATATYQWQRCQSADGTFTDISGATSSTYKLTGADCNCYIQVIATGSGNYSGTVTSAVKGPVVSTAITSIGSIGGTAQVGQTLTAGTLAPSGATATYQWKKCSTPNGAYVDIDGATGNTYTLDVDDYNYYIKVTATGTDGYTGTVTSSRKGKVAAAPISEIADIIGTPLVGETLAAGAVTPNGATVTYQWQRSLIFGIYVNIYRATDDTYTVSSGDYLYSIRVVVTGTGGYSGTVSSDGTDPVGR